MLTRIVTWVVVVSAAVVAGGLIAGALQPSRESRIQRLFPDCREYSVRLRAIGPEEWRHRQPETISLMLFVGRCEPGAEEEWAWTQYEIKGSLALWVSPRDLACEEEVEDARTPAGVLSEPLLRSRLATLGVSAENAPSLDAELSELVGLVREVASRGSWRMMYPEGKGARSAGLLRHFDAYENGLLRYYSASAGWLIWSWIACSAGFLGMAVGGHALWRRLRCVRAA